MGIKKINIVLCFALIIFNVYFVSIIIINYYSEIKKRAIWKSEFVDRNIKTISFTFYKDSFEIKGRRGLKWIRAQNVYVNNKKVLIDSLYRKFDFLRRHGSKYYALEFYNSLDSVVFKMPPDDIELIYRGSKYSPYFIRNGCFPNFNINDNKYISYLEK